MKIRTLCISLAIVLFLMNAAPTPAKQKAEPSRDWATVKALAVGSTLLLKTKDGKKFDGLLEAVSDIKITLMKKGQRIELDEARIAQVYLLTPRTVKKSVVEGAIIGAAAGFVTGAIFGIWLGSYEENSTPAVILAVGSFFAIMGLGIGALGGFIASFWKKKTLIYVAR